MFEVQLGVEEYKYLQLTVDSSTAAKLLLTAVPTEGSSHGQLSYSRSEDTAVRSVQTTYGRAVYTTDGLAFYGILEQGFGREAPLSAMSPLLRAQAQVQMNAQHLLPPPSLGLFLEASVIHFTHSAPSSNMPVPAAEIDYIWVKWSAT